MTDRKKTYKIVVVGDAQSGKSSLLFRFVQRRFCTDLSSTVLAQFFSKTLPTGDRVNMWDTAGQERYRSLLPQYLKNIDLILFVYDITRSSSFKHLDEMWIEWSRNHATPGTKQDIASILVGNKTDLDVVNQFTPHSKRAVTTDEGKAFAAKVGMPFFEISVKDNKNIDELWGEIANSLMAGTQPDTPNGNGIVMLKDDGVDMPPKTLRARLTNCYSCVLM